MSLLLGVRAHRLKSMAVANRYAEATDVATMRHVSHPKRGSLNVGRRGSVLKAVRLDGRRGSIVKHVAVQPPPPDPAASDVESASEGLKAQLAQNGDGGGDCSSSRARWRDVAALVHAANQERTQHGRGYRARLSREARRGITVLMVLHSIPGGFAG